MTWPTKKIGEILKQISETLTQAFSKRNAVVKNEVPSSEVTIAIDQPVERKSQEIITEPLSQESVKKEGSDAGFLICPIQAKDQNGLSVTPYSVKISAVLDHSGTAIDPGSNKHWGKNAKDQKVKAFNGEIGEGTQCPEEPCGYPKKDEEEFFNNKEINYVGVLSDGGKKTLQYDGHAGYDFPYPKLTEIVAPADGKLCKAAQGKDLIYGANWNIDHSFYIVHENWITTWFRHCEKLADSLEAQILDDFTRPCSVKRGEVVAYVGNKGTIGMIHLHFEVRDKDGKIIDPYANKLWQNS